jgi:hypothetical protein
MGRPTWCRPLAEALIIGKPRVDGLHHRYEWQEAAMIRLIRIAPTRRRVRRMNKENTQAHLTARR